MQSIILYKRLLGYLKPYWKIALVAIFTTALYATTDPLLIKLMQPLIDDGLAAQDLGEVYRIIMLLSLVIVFRAVCFFSSNVSSRWISSQIIFDLRLVMFKKLQMLPHRYFDKNNSGSILSRFNYDVQQLTVAITEAAITAIKEGMTVLALLLFLFFQNWALTLIILVIVPIVALIIRFVSKKLRSLAAGIQGNMGYMNHILDENIKGHKIVKIYHGITHEYKKFYSAAENVRKASVKSEVTSSLSTPTVEFIITAVLAFVVIFSVYSVERTGLTTGGFVSYVAMMALLFSPIKKLTRINEHLQKGLAASESLFEFLDSESESESYKLKDGYSYVDKNIDTKDIGQAMPKDNDSFKISFSDVNFSYNDSETVLKDFCLDIRNGEQIGIVGASGSGKSSLAALLPRFYDTNSGTIKVDGRDIKDWPLLELREKISFVNQNIVLFEGSVCDNIAYGVPKDKIDFEKVYLAAEKAFAKDFINALPNGFDTPIGESGARLSGGQRQRIAIARAIYKNASIFILDEATSALDNESEKMLQKSIASILKGKTALIIAHRLSTVQHADRIVVLEEGKIVESGSHKDLLHKRGAYFRLNQESDKN